MRLRQSLKNLAKPALLLVSLSFPFGCNTNLGPVYQKKDLALAIKEISKKDYHLDLVIKESENSLWVYAPLEKLLHPDFGIIENRYFADEAIEKMNNILTAVNRVLLNAEQLPEFVVIVFADITQGAEYVLISYSQDLRKSFANYIPYAETERRRLWQFKLVPEAKGDIAGNHIQPFDIYLPQFLALQLAQRITSLFSAEEYKNHFKVNSVEGNFDQGHFYILYDIERISSSRKNIELTQLILDTVSYCLEAYEFKDFIDVTLIDKRSEESLTFNSKAIFLRNKN